MSHVAAGGDAMVALSTASSADEARLIATALVEEQLAACANVVGPVTSVYRWKGSLNVDPEYMLVIKTRRELLEGLASRLRELHSYECPELISWPIEAGLTGYLEWLRESTGSR